MKRLRLRFPRPIYIDRMNDDLPLPVKTHGAARTNPRKDSVQLSNATPQRPDSRDTRGNLLAYHDWLRRQRMLSVALCLLLLAVCIAAAIWIALQ